MSPTGSTEMKVQYAKKARALNLEVGKGSRWMLTPEIRCTSNEQTFECSIFRWEEITCWWRGL